MNRLIRVEELSPGRVVVQRFSGPVTDVFYQSQGEELRKWIDFRGFSRGAERGVIFRGQS